jgi:hypothetical protein
MEINPMFKNGDTIYYISLEEIEVDCVFCLGEGRIKKLFHKCGHCNNGKVKKTKWVIKYHFDHAFINQLVIATQYSNELQYVLNGCLLMLWERDMFSDIEDAKKECGKRNNTRET